MMNRLKSRLLRLSALALALVFALSVIPPVPAAAEDGAVLRIKSKAELIAFAESCTLDSYSKNLTVYLDADIELMGERFSPVPIFFGSFDGQGHTISGLNVSERGSRMGLFRTVQYGASVRRLKVSGAVFPTGSAESAALICGENYGLISYCQAAGAVSGAARVGGVAGKNLDSGVIVGCTSEAAVEGGRDTGGIAGSNEGLIENCTNKGKINTSGKVTAVPDADRITDITQYIAEGALDASLGREDAEERNLSTGAPHNTGGVAGQSTGTVRGCVNEGAVGYKHLGYNTGGIVGIQSGVVARCENRGEILGRKDVGGIVGQFEPDIAIKYEGSRQDLEGEIQKLNDILKTLSNSLSASTDTALEDADAINSAVGNIETAIKDTGDTGRPELENTLDTVYNCLQIIGSSTERLNNALHDFTEAFNRQSEIILSGLDDIADALARMNASGNVAAITRDIDQINASLDIIAASLGDLSKLYQDVNAVLQSEEMSVREKEEAILQILQEYSETIDRRNIESELRKIVAAADNINAELEKINGKLDAGAQTILNKLDVINYAADSLRAASNVFSNALTSEIAVTNKQIDNIEDVLYSYIGGAVDRWDRTFDTVYGELSIINGSLDNIIATGKSANAATNNLVNAALDQFGVVGSTVASMLDTPSYTAVDVSEDILSEEKAGQVSGCRNSGSVNADVNVGGVAGIMAVEVGDDPETDFDMSEGLWADTTALFRAIIMDGENSGAVISKNGAAGGIVGRCDVGAVYKMNNTGSVQAGAPLCGGIAGFSSGSTISCGAMCALTGGDEVGGVAGRGHNISKCRTMVTIIGEGEKRGAVAGGVGGQMLENIFVLESLAGVDGVSYEGKAYGLPYSEFVELEGLPAFFGSLHIDFVSEGTLIKRAAVEYGGGIDEAEVPVLPAREDSYGVWEDYVSENILRNQVVNAKYLPWEKTVSDGEKLPTLLAEGQFSDEAVLTVTARDAAPSASLAYEAVAAYDYELSDPRMPKTDKTKLHLRCEDAGQYLVTVQEGAETVPAETVRDGSYLVFTAPLSGTVTVYRSYTRIIILCAAGLAVLILAAALAVFLKKRRKKQPREKTKKPKKGAHEK